MASCQAGKERFGFIHSLPSMIDNPSAFQMDQTLSAQEQQTTQSSRENSPTCSTFGKQLWLLHFGSSIPLSRSENQGRAREAITPSQVQHCGQRARKTQSEKDVPEGCFALSGEGASSQWRLVLEAHSFRQVETHRHFTYLKLTNTFNLLLQGLTCILPLPSDGQVAEH